MASKHKFRTSEQNSRFRVVGIGARQGDDVPSEDDIEDNYLPAHDLLRLNLPTFQLASLKLEVLVLHVIC